MKKVILVTSLLLSANAVSSEEETVNRTFLCENGSSLSIADANIVRTETPDKGTEIYYHNKEVGFTYYPRQRELHVIDSYFEGINLYITLKDCEISKQWKTR